MAPPAQRVGRLKGALAAWVSSAPTPIARLLHRAIARDPAWAAAYDELRLVERVAAGAPPLGRRQEQLLERLVLEELASVSGNEPRRALPALALVAAACVLVLAVTRTGDSATGDSVGSSAAAWTARHGAAGARVGAQVRCVPSTGSRVLATAVAGPRQREGRLACPKDALLAFSWTNLEDQPYHLFVVGVGASGGVRFYAPFHEHAASVEMTPGGVDQLLPVLADPTAMPLEEVVLFALFSTTPLRGADVQRELTRAQRNDLALSGMERLPLPVPLQARIALDRR